MSLFSRLARQVLRVVPLLLIPIISIGSSGHSVSAQEGDRTYRVVYVASDDVLNMRAGPSVGYAIVGRIPPGGRGVRMVGRCRDWCPVSYHGASGWVNPVYLAPESSTARRDPDDDDDEPAQPRGRGYASAEPPVARQRALMSSYWRVTGIAEGESLRVHDGPSATASVVHAFEPDSGCIKITGGCQKPWCQVKFPGLNGERVGWVDSKHLAPASGTCR
jgi:uncharacterized protein YraI